MNKKEQTQLAVFPAELDKIVQEKFGVVCKSSLDFFGTGGYVTHYEGEGIQKENIQSFIDGFIAGNQELGQRLLSIKH